MAYGNLKSSDKEKNMKFLISTLLLLILFPASVGCTHSNTYGPYNGKVIDAETKEPIGGAAVLVVFYTNEPGPAGSITRYADAIETVTDKNGEFQISKHKVTSTKFLYLLDNHGYFTIFKPGYGHYPDSKGVSPMFVPNGTLPENQYVTIELPRLKTREERLKNTMINLSSEIPTEKYKNLNYLINQELNNLGRPATKEEK